MVYVGKIADRAKRPHVSPAKFWRTVREFDTNFPKRDGESDRAFFERKRAYLQKEAVEEYRCA